MSSVANNIEVWAPVSKVAPCLHCSANYLHKCGRAGLFGYRQSGPKLFELRLPEAIDFYTAKYPNIAVDREALESLMHSTA